MHIVEQRSAAGVSWGCKRRALLGEVGARQGGVYFARQLRRAARPGHLTCPAAFERVLGGRGHQGEHRQLGEGRRTFYLALDLSRSRGIERGSEEQ